ncbi:hypothetical protein P1J78_12710 [Psychromarinibacter sp. C21-152]|uniref:Uncharacterized protein n=1 Tax=Psychromarinibacter sediminicola TaxID=3033385 RepID=A0AAE3TA36_9RHOB|nr:hypothetical protein [Psychromarinibacter sediminicola]MDF0601599.1 hypothetical protein [Psychromarinibacter sediminicola]
MSVTQGFRRTFDLRYQVTGQPSGRPQIPLFFARPESAQRDGRVWKTIWEDARARLARNPMSRYTVGHVTRPVARDGGPVPAS